MRLTTVLAAALTATLGFTMLGALTGPRTSASAADQPSDALSLSAVGQSGGYFTVNAAAGSTTQLTVSRTNTSAAPTTARTYPANTYSIVNGGFGAETRDNAASGVTQWLSYKDEVLALAPAQVNTTTFTVKIPAGTAPGDYLSGVVLENDVPIEGTGSISLNQIYRHILAVSIRVPGAYKPAFTLAKPAHSYSGSNSIVGATIDNSGNRNLRPAGNIVVKDSTGTVVSDAPVTMGSLYAHNITSVQATLGGQLNPGKYTVTITLKDAGSGASAELTDAAFTVEKPLANTGAGPIASLPQIFQDGAGGVSAWFWAAVALLVLLLAAGVFFGRRWLLKRRAAAKALAGASTESDSSTEATSEVEANATPKDTK